MPAIAWQLVALPDTEPRAYPCGVGTAPYVKTFMQVPGWGDLYLCSSCAREFARCYALAPETDLVAAREQHEIAAARIREMDAQLDAESRRFFELESEIGAAEIDGLRDTVDVLKRQCDTLTRENTELRKGETASVIRDAIADVRATAVEPKAGPRRRLIPK